MVSYNESSYAGICFGKYHGIFTDSRIDRNTIPKDVFCYDVRTTDSGSLCTIENFVRVNHGGTILMMTPIKMPKGRDYYTLRNWTFMPMVVEQGKVDSWFESEKGRLVQKKAAYFLNEVIDSPEKMPYPVATAPISDEWKRELSSRWWYSENIKNEIVDTELKNKMIKLRETLLSFGGEEVCLPVVEEDIDNILSRGQLWMGDKVDMMRGEPCQCHSNSAACWSANKDKTTIVTGYALSEDGLWRQHSWVIHFKPRQNRIVETTRRRVLYYGFAMTEKECEDFEYYNY